MRIDILRSALAIAAFVAAPVLANDLDKPIKVDTSGLQASVAKQVEQRAAESTKALMEYLWFTRRVNHLWIDDVTRTPKDALASNDGATQPRQMATRTTGLR